MIIFSGKTHGFVGVLPTILGNPHISIYSRSGTQPHQNRLSSPTFDFLFSFLKWTCRLKIEAEILSFPWTSINLNCNYAARCCGFFANKNTGVLSGQIITTKTPVCHPKWWWKVRESTQNPRNIQVWELIIILICPVLLFLAGFWFVVWLIVKRTWNMTRELRKDLADRRFMSHKLQWAWWELSILLVWWFHIYIYTV